ELRGRASQFFLGHPELGRKLSDQACSSTSILASTSELIRQDKQVGLRLERLAGQIVQRPGELAHRGDGKGGGKDVVDRPAHRVEITFDVLGGSLELPVHIPDLLLGLSNSGVQLIELDADRRENSAEISTLALHVHPPPYSR